MTGGFKGTVNQVRQEDLDGAKNSLLEKLKNETADYFAEKADKDFIFTAEGMSREILEASSSVAA